MDRTNRADRTNKTNKPYLSYLSCPPFLSYFSGSMISVESKQFIESLCPEVGKEVVQAFFDRMDEDYFANFSAEEISTHIKMSCMLDAERPAQCLVAPRGPGERREPGGLDEFDIVIVGFDYLSEFSIFCGLLSAFGLDIRAGNVYSFARRDSVEKLPRLRRRGIGGKAPQPSQRKIVDVFNTRLRPGETFDEAKRREFEH